jgi:transcriptional regulator with XRE-family HTH domain
MILMPIRLRIREARELAGWTQEELAAKAGIRRATLSRLERGLTKGIDFATLEQLADALEVRADRLIVHEPKRRRAS